ncbi:MAG: acetyl-CoA carboxylase biotin carboxyl carrier protein subunit [Saprospiraceae bacterium]|nr:acetyl-CoA carboxylase biotin carboxyl carrier protein subunit [Saprospiraceae bacterium]
MASRISPQLYKALVNGETEIDISADELADLDLVKLDAGFHVHHGHAGFHVQVVHADYSRKSFVLRVGHQEVRVELKDAVQQQVESMGFERNSSQHVNEIIAPMPGLVLDVRVRPGDTIEEHQPLVILEAMKMENVLSAPRAGVIAEVLANKGATVDKGQVLVSLE